MDTKVDRKEIVRRFDLIFDDLEKRINDFDPLVCFKGECPSCGRKDTSRDGLIAQLTHYLMFFGDMCKSDTCPDELRGFLARTYDLLQKALALPPSFPNADP